MRGTGSAPYTTRSEQATREWNAERNLWLPTRGDPNVMHLTSAFGYSKAAHVAPAGAKPHETREGDEMVERGRKAKRLYKTR
jgi:hypothetical protein